MKKRRLIALLLCICMTTGIFTPVLAADEEEAVIVAEDSDQISYEEIYTGDDVNEIQMLSETAYSDTMVSGDFKYVVNDDGTATITGFVGEESGDLVIPEEIDGYTVTAIGDKAFYKCNGFRGSLIIPDTIISIGYAAFYGCWFKGDLTIGNNVVSIGRSAFDYCDDFTGSLTIPDSVISIGVRAFYGCEGFTGSLTIPDSVNSIGEMAFVGCKNIENIIVDSDNKFYSSMDGILYNIDKTLLITCPAGKEEVDYSIPDNVTSIDDYAFYNCSSFTGSLMIGDSVVSIGNYAFSNCFRLTGSLTIGDSVTSIGNNAFSDCRGFTGNLKIPDSVTSIGESAFSGCSGFTGDLIIGNSVISIGKRAFYLCKGFTGSLTIPDSVISIGNDAFIRCESFTGNLTIGNSVTYIGGNAFNQCSGFTGNLTIPDSVTYIGGSAFSGCSGFTGNLTIGNSITTISQEAFSGCSGFTGNLMIGNSVTSIEKAAFSGCSGFTGNLRFPDSVTLINERAFSGCSGFTGNLIIPDNVISIKKGAFQECINLENIIVDSDNKFYSSVDGILYNFDKTELIMCLEGKEAFDYSIPNSVICINDYAFYGCKRLSGSLTIPDSVISIGVAAFSNCNGFTGNLVMGNSVTSIEMHAFANCTGFTGSLVIPDSVTSIGAYAFSDCDGFIGNLNIGDSVISIGNQAFYHCDGLTGNLIIPDSVTSIGNSVFFACPGIEAAYFYGDVPTSWGRYIFGGMANGFTIYYPEGNTSGWTSPTWTAPDGRVYNTATFVPDSVSTSITTTFDTTEILIEEDTIFNFNGLVSTTAETGLNDLQINIANAETGVGIKYHREDDIGTSQFDLSAVPSFVMGTTLTGEDEKGYKHTLELTAGTSWYVHLFATDNNGNSIGEDVVKKITITENPGEFLIGKTFKQTTNLSGQDMNQKISSFAFGENHTGTFNWFDSEIGAMSTEFFYSVVADEITLVPVSPDWFVGLAKEVTLQIIDNDHLQISSIVRHDGNSPYLGSYTVVGDKFEMELPQVAPTVTGLQDNYTVTQGESLIVNFTVTAGAGANLKVVTVQNSVTGINCYRQPDISANSHTVNCTIPVNGLDVGIHNFIVYASADNYTVTDNNVATFTVTVKEKEVVSGKLELSEQGKKLLKNLEGGIQKDGLHLLYDDDHDYSDGWENPTIGHGTLVSDALLTKLSDGKYTSKSQLPKGVKYSSSSREEEIEFLYSTVCVSITDNKASELFENELVTHENAANDYLKKHDLSVTQNEFDAIAMFVYNLGKNYLDDVADSPVVDDIETDGVDDYRISKVLRGVLGPNNEPIDEVTVKEAFTSNCNNPPLKGLIKRRLCEAYVYLYGYVDGKTNPESYYTTEDYDYYWYVRQNRDNPDINPSIYLNPKIEGEIEQPDETQEYTVTINDSVITSDRYENPNNSKLVITISGISKSANYSSLQMINLSTEGKLEIECDEINNGIAKYSVSPKKIEQGLYKLSFYSGKNEKIYDSAVLINSFEVTHYEIKKTHYNVWYDFCNDERDEYINEKINEWLEDERIIDTLENDKYAIFFFEGAGNELGTSTRMAALCVVFHYNNGEITIAFEDRNSTTIPDQPRYPNTNKGKDVPICRDGIYIVKTTNHPCYQEEIIDGKKTDVNYPYAALKVSCNSYGDVLRTNGTKHYEDQSGGINVHARSQNYIAGKNADWANSAGCFNVGLNEVDKNGRSSGFTKYNEFIEVFTGVKNARTLNKKNNKTTKSGIEVGYVIVDRTLYEVELNNIYGNDNTSSSKETVKLILNEK